MIKGIKANGFRSLIDFSVALSSGLNVIVGPNGSGKTNFVDLLDFGSLLIQHGLHEAMSHCGGSTSVFAKEVLGTSKKEILITYSGQNERPLPRRNPSLSRNAEEWDQKYKIAAYTFAVTIKYDPKNARIYISKEELNLAFANGDKKRVKRTTSFGEDEAKHTVTLVPKNSVLWRDMAQSFGPNSVKDASAIAFILEYLERNIDENTSILSSLQRVSYQFYAIAQDITGLASLNIKPNQAAKECPVTQFSEIKRDGDGLASLLYLLQENIYRRSVHQRSFLRQRARPFGKKIFEQIEAWTTEINPDIAEIRVELSPEDILLKPKITFHSNTKYSYPFSRLSDGTVKWIALVTLLLSESGYSIIEEPENFLHPFMQEKFIELLRKKLSPQDDAPSIITTHSETLLNQCSVDEIIVFFSRDGKTRARKPTNRKEIAELIETTRFSLGYFYRTGALDID